YASYSKDKEAFQNVSKLIFTSGSRVKFSISKVSNLSYEPLIATLPEKPVPVTDAVCIADGDLAIKVSDLKLYREYLFSQSKKSTPDSATKITAVKESAKMSVRDVLSDPGNAQNINNVVSSANQIISILKRKDTALSTMLTKNARDLYIYNHSLNVSVLSAAMALAMGMDQSQIEKLALGAIMHDIGKRNIPTSILYKRERLTDEEFAVWKKHVADSVDILSQSGLPSESLVAVKQHHERLSGTGYPYSLKGTFIRPFGKIISIVDCYDSLTTPRPFRTTYTPFNALDKIMKEAAEKGDFDLELVKLFIKILKGQGRL
ncbi:MAG: HD domain-containing protein, partial [Nitrospirae bacterium]|nr:HD domain-containing protein [Nitrospirota bacterium]